MNRQERGRFQVWEYTVSHRQLLVRRPGAPDSPNIDITFSGVLHVSLPTFMPDPRIRPPSPPEMDLVTSHLGHDVPDSFVHVFDGSGWWGFVVSEGEPRRSENDLQPFETGLDISADVRSSAEQYEKSVLLALSSLTPLVGPETQLQVGARSLRLDALLTEGGKRLGLEVKWTSDGRPRQSVRSGVMQTVERLQPWLDQLDGLLVVVRVDNPAWTHDLEAHLTTATGLPVVVVGWDPPAPSGLLLGAAARLFNAA